MKLKIIIFTAVFLMLPYNVFAVRYLQINKNDIVYSDSFSKNNLSEWTVLTPLVDWHTQDFNGTISLTTDYNNQWMGTVICPSVPVQCSDYNINVVMTPAQSLNRNSVVFRVCDEKNMYRIVFLWENGTNTLSLNKRLDCTQYEETVLFATGFANNSSGSVFVRIEVNENNIRCYVNNSLKINYTDNDNPIMYGKAGLMQDFGKTYFNRFEIRKR